MRIIQIACFNKLLGYLAQNVTEIVQKFSFALEIQKPVACAMFKQKITVFAKYK